ncbi:restriction endonuclease [Pseudomonas aeruginosa]|uniref:hypothetical protein n=1 Tax=Pseudomonas aeruginosa TaxID=287 RepID=UPI001CBBDC2A|nr:hypothetical protein [Pseudomonas aeruginosa]MBZ3677526.1 restriction endonuclease [Pseudomonas aeruginosa]MBZ3688521.1 restriction endonuclease [Pseudomonas aeruginosa]
MNTSSGEDLERLTAMVFKRLFEADGRDVKISQPLKFNKNVNGVNSTYEVDIFYEFQVAGIVHRVAVECKNWVRPVSKGQILEFAQKVKCIGGDVIGIFVSANGYQQGAEADALHLGIKTYTPESLPSFHDLLEIKFKQYIFPKKETKADPFYALLDKSFNWPALDFFGSSAIPIFIQKSTAERLLSETQEWEEGGFDVFGLSKYHLSAHLAFFVKGNTPDLHVLLITSSEFSIRNGYGYQFTAYTPAEFCREFISN